MSTARTAATAGKSRVAICQIRSTPDVERNLEVVGRLVRRAKGEGAEACFLPEATDFIVPTQDQCYDLSQPLHKHTFTNGLQALARELGVWIGVGIHELPTEEKDGEEVARESQTGKKVFNSFVAIQPSGEIAETYRKIHLFDIALPASSPSEPPTKTGESLRVLPGSRIVPPLQMTPVLGPVGLEICYDLRFPEMHRLLVDNGAKVLLFPAAFTVPTGRDHWCEFPASLGVEKGADCNLVLDTLLRATAIQYQVYVLAPAQIGEHYPPSITGTYRGRTSWGESLAFDPWGRLLGRLPSVDDTPSSAGEEEGEFFMVELDMSLVDHLQPTSSTFVALFYNQRGFHSSCQGGGEERSRHAMTLPAPLHVRFSVVARFLPFLPSATTPQSPRQLQPLLFTDNNQGGGDGQDRNAATDYPYRQAPRNLEDVVGAVGRWYEGGSDGVRSEGSRSRDRWREWTSRAPLIVAYSLFVITYVPFVVWVGHDQVYVIHHQARRFICLLVVYHFLLGMAILSLYRASATLPGTPDPSYAQAQRQRQAHPQIQPEQQHQHQQPQHIQRPTPEFSSSLSPLLGLPTAEFARFQDRPASPVGRLSPAPGLRRRDSDTPRPPADLENRARGRSGSISFASGTSAGVFPRVYADERVSAGSFDMSVTATTTGEDDVPLSALRRGEVVVSSSPYTSSPRLGAEERPTRTEVPGAPRLNGHGDYPPPPPRLKREDGLAVSGLGRENKLLRRWCGECQGWKPPRCHHCRSCGICVLKMDHHCLWLNTCIGLHNQKAFLLFLLYTTALSGFVGEETGYAVYKWLDGGQVQDITDFRPVANLLLFLVAVTFFLAIGSFLAFHLYLASNNRTTLENLRPSLPPAALIEPASATPLLGRRNSASPTSSRTSSPDRTVGSGSPTFADPPPAYTPLSGPTTGARHSRLHKIQLESSPRLNLAQTPTSFTATGMEDPPWRWQWRWKSDHLLTRNERKTVRWVAENANIYDLGDAWSNLVGVLDGSGMDVQLLGEGVGKDLEAGGGEVPRRGGVSLGRCLRWFWPGETVTTARGESRHTVLSPGHDFPISQRAIDLIRHKTYGLRSRRQVPIRPARIPDGEDGGMTVRSSNEYEFESEDGYEEDEVGWAV